MNEQQKPQNTVTPQNVTPNNALQSAPQTGQQYAPNFNQPTLPTESRTSTDTMSIFILLTLTFCFGIPFFGFLIKEILDTSYDGGGLGYLILLVFFLPPFLLFGIISTFQAIKMRSNGQKVAVSTILKAFLLGLIITAAFLGLTYLERVWSSFF